MSRFAQALLAAAAASMILVAGASSRALAGASDAPVPVSPAPGSSFVGGTPIVFQVSTFPGDTLLLLNVSRSPSVSACGVIGSEVASKIFGSTSDASDYQAAPFFSPGGWMDTPGTYYWQAYRVVYGGGSDGCIESEVRSFTITPGPQLTPPTLLEPSPAQNITVGTSVSFRIRTYAGDKSLSLRLSSSPQLDASGRLRGDIYNGSFTATSDPAVYETKPTHVAGDWMDTPGTYYWQAYRTYFGAGSDGYVESEVRSLRLADPPPKSLAAARLEGKFVMYLTVRSTSGTKNLRRGQIYELQWAFTPRCSKGSCHTNVDISSLTGSFTRGTVQLKRKGVNYTRRGRTALFRCLAIPLAGPLRINLRVKRGAWIEKEWKAVQVAGSLKYSVAAKTYSYFRCDAGHLNASLRGVLSK